MTTAAVRRHPLVRIVLALAVLAAGVAALLVLGWLLLVFLIVPPVEVVTVATLLVTVLIVGGVAAVVVRSNRTAALSRRDKLTLGLMVGIPTAVLTIFILVPTVASLTLSLTSWNGIGGLDKIQFIGLQNYIDLHQVYKPFYPALHAQPHLAALLPLHRHAAGHVLRRPAGQEHPRHALLPERAVHAGRALAGHRGLHLDAHLRA